MKKYLLGRRVLFYFALPVFFVLHGYNANYGLIFISDISVLLLTYLIAELFLFLLFYFFLENIVNAALLGLFVMVFYFFFGSLYDFLKTRHIFFYHYKYLVSAFFICFIVLAYYFKRNRSNPVRLPYYLNVLSLVYFSIEILSLLNHFLHPRKDLLSIYPAAQTALSHHCDTCRNPDIYLLVFDEYASSLSLKTDYGFDNADLDSFFLQRQFFIARRSHSNYNFTPFSMASILNMNYIHGIANVQAVTADDYAACNQLIKNDAVIGFLSARSYAIVNYSIFDLAGHPSLVVPSLLPVRTRLITAQTFFSRVKRDLSWQLATAWGPLKLLANTDIYQTYYDNTLILKKVVGESASVSATPKFVYAHFMMPHPPFYFGIDSRIKTAEELHQEAKKITPPPYLNYLPYVNDKIKTMVNAIIINSGGKAVIIVMGDHGFRIKNSQLPASHYFQNMNNVYLPDKKYTSFNDSTGAVNQFRYIFNALYDQRLKILKDSSIMMEDFHELNSTNTSGKNNQK